LSVFELTRILWPKLLAPLPNGFIGDGNAAFGQQFFHFSQAETESMIPPDGMADNFGGKSMTVVAGLYVFPAAQSAKRELN
jgi:hypothetical protein